jgi:hypothetical protein
MIYLIHLNEKLHHAQHYIGFIQGNESASLENRLNRHKSGQGSKMLKAAILNGILFNIVRIWKEGDRKFERKLKNKKNAKFLCPVCNPALKLNVHCTLLSTNSQSANV